MKRQVCVYISGCYIKKQLDYLLVPEITVENT